MLHITICYICCNSKTTK